MLLNITAWPGAWAPAARPGGGASRTDCPTDPPGPGHLVKARYTPLQAIVAGPTSRAQPHHEVLRDADALDGMPVVVADLHSALPAVLAGFYIRGTEDRVPARLPGRGWPT